MSTLLPSLFVSETALERPVREQLLALEAAMAQVPGAVFGNSELCPLTHTFADGIYVREIFIPKGTLVVGKLHRWDHPNFLLKGEVIVVTEGRGREHLVAPLAMISPAGTKRAVYALEDTVWCTVHTNTDNVRDIDQLEAHIIAPDYATYEAERLARQEEEP